MGFAILANVGICRQVNLSSNALRIRAALKKWTICHARQARSDYTSQRGFGQYAPEHDAPDRNLSITDGTVCLAALSGSIGINGIRLRRGTRRGLQTFEIPGSDVI